MDNEKIKETFRAIAGIKEKDAEAFIEGAKPVSLKKNQYLVHGGDQANGFYLIRSGCLMTYFRDSKGNIHVLQFGTEMWWTGDLEGFMKNQPSYYSVKALLASEVLIIDREHFGRTMARVPSFERYFRVIFQNALISHQRRIMRNISYTAEERYEEFERLYPKLEMIVPQKYIASYLGITPEFLSKIRRIRAGK